MPVLPVVIPVRTLLLALSFFRGIVFPPDVNGQHSVRSDPDIHTKSKVDKVCLVAVVKSGH